ncbi:MAG: transaldolase [Nocardioidaceae bacterium]
MNDRLTALSDAGVSIWLDDLSRERIASGNLADLVKGSSVVGVTTNPTIFASALSHGERYNEQVRLLAADGASTAEAILALTTTDVRDACDILAPVAEQTDGVDGRVSIEVDPAAAHDTDESVAQAKKLWSTVGRDNLFIKIPATAEGIDAISAVLAEGINVNVTLIFALERYRAVMDAYLSGLEQARDNGHDLSRLHSVASFFVSRVDTEVDKRLDEIGGDAAARLHGKAALANARLAYQAYEETFSGDRFNALVADGARTQRPLWASTGVKDPKLPDTLYVKELVVADCVNTMPEKTLQAFADHGEVSGDTVHGTYDQSRAVLDQLEELGVPYDEVVATLEDEGIDKFAKSWEELVASVEGELAKAGEDT